MATRLGCMAAVAVGLLAAPLAADAQQAPRVARVGYLEPGSAASGAPHLEAFRQGLGELGWVEGRNIAIEVRYAGGKFDQLPALAAELVRLKVDLIFAATTPAALAVKRATATIPVVIGWVADPVGSGLVASLGRPGGNVTGWTHQGGDLRGKYLDLLKEAVPGATRIGVLMNPANPIHVGSLNTLEAAAQALKVQLHPVWVKEPEDFDKGFSGLAREKVQALVVLPEGMFLAHRDLIVGLAARSRLPALHGVIAFAEAGGLMAYGVNLPDMFRRGASFVDRILKGARPADLPVEQPTRFELVVNLKTAKALGLTLPPSILARADTIIE
jgi:putative ABC transport system substrate-binding protein